MGKSTSLLLILACVIIKGCSFGTGQEYGLLNRQEELISRNLELIQTRLEHHASQNGGEYPEDIYVILNGTYASPFYSNPITRVDVENVPYGDVGSEGDITYLPVKIDGKVVGYYIIAYGVRRSLTRDLNQNGIKDNILTIVEGSQDGVDLPPVRSLI